MNDALSTDCETRARARMWIAKFDNDDGRYRSQKKKEFAEIVTASQGQYAGFFSYPLWNPPLAVGRWDYVRSNADACAIGDAFPFPPEHDLGSVEWLEFTGIHPCRFKKVESQITADGGMTWGTKYFWERVE